MKKILHIISSLRAGGAERSLYNLCNSSLNENFQQYVVCLGEKGVYGKMLENIGVKVFYINLRILNIPSKIYYFLKIIKSINPELIQGWMTHGNFFSIIAYYLLNSKPIIVWNIRQTIYRLSDESLLTGILFRINRFFSEIPSDIIANSNLAINQLKYFGYTNHSFIYVPNGFDTKFWKKNEMVKVSLKNELRLKDSDFIIGFVGRYHRMKNISLLFDAFEILTPHYPNIKLMIVGHNDKNYTKFEKIKSESLKDRILFIESNHNVNDYYSLLNVLVLCSAWGEGFPNVLGEAMSNELCCISTSVGEAPELLKEVGYVIQVNDSNTLAEKIKFCLENPRVTLEMGKKARKKIESTYSLNSTIETYKMIYHNALKPRK